jgi:hypothetical protein
MATVRDDNYKIIVLPNMKIMKLKKSPESQDAIIIGATTRRSVSIGKVEVTVLREEQLIKNDSLLSATTATRHSYL